MGECIFINHSGKSRKLPILNANYPADVSVEYGGSATFKVEITTHGYPEKYTYQWYKNGTAISGATNSSYSVSGQTASATFYCIVTNKEGTVQSRTATFTVGTAMPNYTYTGSHNLISDGNGNWRLKLTSTGILKFTNRGTGVNGIDVFLVGGGGGGFGGGDLGYMSGGGGGGGGGYTTTAKGISVQSGVEYQIVVGGGGSTNGNGGKSTAFGQEAKGGNTGGNGGSQSGDGGHGGSGGGGYYAKGASDGADAVTYTENGTTWGYGGKGQGRTTREFGESGATLYSGGGGGGSSSGVNTVYAGGDGGGGAGGYRRHGVAGTNGLGGGGGGTMGGDYGTRYDGGPGGSGIVIIRNKR